MKDKTYTTWWWIQFISSLMVAAFAVYAFLSNGEPLLKVVLITSAVSLAMWLLRIVVDRSWAE